MESRGIRKSAEGPISKTNLNIRDRYRAMSEARVEVMVHTHIMIMGRHESKSYPIHIEVVVRRTHQSRVRIVRRWRVRSSFVTIIHHRSIRLRPVVDDGCRHVGDLVAQGALHDKALACFRELATMKILLTDPSAHSSKTARYMGASEAVFPEPKPPWLTEKSGMVSCLGTGWFG